MVIDTKIENYPPEQLQILDELRTEWETITENFATLNNITSGLTVIARVNTPTTTNRAIVSNSRDCCGVYNGYQLDKIDVSDNYRMKLWNGAANPANVTAASSIVTSQWQTIAGTWNGAQIVTYLDGTPNTPSLCWSNRNTC